MTREEGLMTTPQEAMRKALEYAEAQCGNRCNAEYNPCWAQEVADALRTALAQQGEPPDQRLVNLLCRIHRDGGHYIAKHGIDKAVIDADVRVAQLNALTDTAAPAPVAQQGEQQPVAPLTDEQVQRAMHAINEVSCGDIQPTFEEMRVALLAARGIKEGK